MAVSGRLLDHYYPDFSRSGTLAFYDWLDGALRPDWEILNLGAGRACRQRERVLKGRVRQLVGADIDSAVLANDEVDEAHLVRDGRLPFGAGRFDLIYSDWTLEHVERPRLFLAEVHRVLRPGGQFFFRTSNLFHYSYLAAWLLPNRLHPRIVARARGLDGDRVCRSAPAFYRMNTALGLERLAEEAGFAETEIRFFEPEPAYVRFNDLSFLLGVAYERLVNAFEQLQNLRASILGRMRK